MPTYFDDKWKYIPSSFDGILNNDSNQLVVINYPSNPTGMSYTSGELEELARRLDRDGTLVLSDELYSE